MFRTQPPRGRAASLVLFAVVALIALLAAPAFAAGELTVSASQKVSGRDPLVLTPNGLAAPVPLVVEITDADGGAATWRYPAVLVGNGEALSVDLSAPDSGSPPRNGRATVQVSTPAGEVAAASTTIDRAPPVPTLRSVVRGQRVGVTWNPVAAHQAVTYRLERIGPDSGWAVVQESQSSGGYTDRDLQPGRYRYRLSVAVRGADGGLNWSGLSATQVKIAAPAPSASPTPAQRDDAPAQEPAPAAKPQPKTNQKPKAKSRAPQQRPRSVAATGAVRGAVPGDDPQLRARPTPLVATAQEPAVDGAAPPLPSNVAAVATPEVAGPATPTPQVAPPEATPQLQPFPVTVPPAGSLAVQAATHAPPDPVTLLGGLVFLVLSARVVYRTRGRRGLRLIQAWVGRR